MTLSRREHIYTDFKLGALNFQIYTAVKSSVTTHERDFRIKAKIVFSINLTYVSGRSDGGLTFAVYSRGADLMRLFRRQIWTHNTHM